MEHAAALAGRASTQPVSNDAPAPPDDRRTVQSVERTLELFELLVAAGQELGLRELGEASRLPVGTVHRLIGTLTRRGYVRQNPATRRYTVGYTAMDLAARIRDRGGLAAQAEPFLRQIVTLTGESANLAAVDGTEAVYLAHLAPPRMVRMFTEVGNRAPLYAAGVGKVLLAYLPPGRLEAVLRQLDLVAYTATTITDRDRLRAELERVRAQGYAYDDGEYEDGVRCVAVPVYDAARQVVGSLSISGPSSRLTHERADAWLPQIVEVARAFSQALGARA